MDLAGSRFLTRSKEAKELDEMRKIPFSSSYPSLLSSQSVSPREPLTLMSKDSSRLSASMDQRHQLNWHRHCCCSLSSTLNKYNSIWLSLPRAAHVTSLKDAFDFPRFFPPRPPIFSIFPLFLSRFLPGVAELGGKRNKGKRERRIRREI